MSLLGRGLFIATVGATIAIAADARAADEPVTPRVELRHDLRVDIPVTVVLAVGVVAWRLTRDALEPSYCRWCDGSSPSEVNALDDWFRTALRRPDTYPANFMSYVLAFGAAPISAAGLTVLASVADNRGDGALVDLLAITQGGLAAMGVTQFIEPLVLRTRPYVLAIQDEEARDAEIAKTGAFHSFPSGHVTTAFGVAAASGVVASMRGYRLAPLVWAAGLMIGVATAYTRIASDRHYFTDTLAGAVIGTVVGGGVPLLFHRPRKDGGDSATTRFLQRATFATTPVPRGQVVSLGWAF